MTKDEALKLALDALEAAYARIVTKCEQNLVTYNGVDVDTLTLSIEAITAIKKVLAQEQEPVAWEQFYPDIGKPQIAFNAEVIGYVAPQRTWVGLAPEDTFEIAERLGLSDIAWVDLMQAIEAKLKEKNSE